MSQGSPEQVAQYGTAAMNLSVIGAYAQTELGHGSNVAQLETTATYDPSTQEFDIHSPTLTSTKWWIGAMGKTATHAVVQAQLILLGGVNKGPHLFIVQLRSLGSLCPCYETLARDD
jgi:acyl-CoA oxidase